jgi:hypothetical protein
MVGHERDRAGENGGEHDPTLWASPRRDSGDAAVVGGTRYLFFGTGPKGTAYPK